jgi:molecular chaperone Hsp33
VVPRADRPMSAHPDDLVIPFEVKPLGVRGRLVRLGPTVDDIVHRHEYPHSVSSLLAEAAALTAMLGTSLKFDGRFILQTSTDGAVDMLVADYQAPGKIRAYARFDSDRVVSRSADEAALLGSGHLAMTVDQGPDMDRYQGIVPLGGVTLTEAAHSYFSQSEQIPTRLRLAAGPLVGRGPAGVDSWRAGAIMVQHLPRQGSSSPLPMSSGNAPEGAGEEIVEDDDWVKARLILDTVEDHELLDPTLTPEELLYRLYHEDGVTVYREAKLERYCTCSRERIGAVLDQFTEQDRREMADDGEIVVTCEFCSTVYRFPAEQ